MEHTDTNLDETRQIRITPRVFGDLVRRASRPGSQLTLYWGRPDKEGFWTPYVLETATEDRDPDTSRLWLWVMLAALLMVGFVAFALGRFTA